MWLVVSSFDFAKNEMQRHFKNPQRVQQQGVLVPNYRGILLYISNFELSLHLLNLSIIIIWFGIYEYKKKSLSLKQHIFRFLMAKTVG